MKNNTSEKGDFVFVCIMLFVLSIYMWFSDYGKNILLETNGSGALAMYNFFFSISLLYASSTTDNKDVKDGYDKTAAVCMFISIYCMIYGFLH